jgi:beta-lactamase class A
MKSLFTLAFAVFSLAIPALGQQTVPPKDRILFQKLESTIHETGKSLDGVLGVYVLDLATGNSIASNADETFPTASTIKIAILAELFHQAQQGKLNLNHIYTLNSSDLVGGSGIASALTPGVTKLTLRDLAALMISVSDNSLTNVLIDRVGMDNINSLLDSLGLSHTRLRRKMMDSKAAAEGRENVSTPREMSQLLQALYKEKVLNKQFTADFFNLLSVKKESYIPRLLPEDLRIANKPGELEGVRNDCGIVFTGKRPYALCVMTTYVRHEREAGDAIARISLAAYEMFDRLDRSSPLGRVVSSRDSSPP